MDSLPVEVIGVILSCMASARKVALASATCRMWREAAKDHLQKLSFDYSDFGSGSGNLQSSPHERIITEVLMRTTCLRALSIFVTRKIEAASVTAWLQHTRKTLECLTFRTPIKPSLNLLDVLFGRESVLKYLEWQCAYIPSVDPTTHRFESLVSLTLYFMGDCLAASTLETLLTVSPRLESLSLTGIHIEDPAPSSIVFKSSSLKSLFIELWFSYPIHEIFLHTDCLKSLWLVNVAFEQVKLVECRGQHSLRCLKLENASIKELDLGKPDSIQEFHLHMNQDLEAEWAKYHHIISSSSNLEKLHLSGIPNGNRFDIGLDKIGSSFPRLTFLALNYKHASNAFKHGSAAKGLIFESITTLELSSKNFNKQFVGWIAGFLELCPNLKQLTIAGTSRFGPSTEMMLGYFSRMAQIMSPYPNINIKYNIL